jgi:hypothetical protein
VFPQLLQNTLRAVIKALPIACVLPSETGISANGLGNMYVQVSGFPQTSHSCNRHIALKNFSIS